MPSSWRHDFGIPSADPIRWDKEEVVKKEDLQNLVGFDAVRAATDRGYVLIVEYPECEMVVNPKIAKTILDDCQKRGVEPPIVRISL
jgi:hypothetical protein